jgi:hypothetical protein
MIDRSEDKCTKSTINVESFQNSRYDAGGKERYGSGWWMLGQGIMGAGETDLE